MRVHADIFCMHACTRGVRKKRECYLRAKDRRVLHRKREEAW